MNVNDFKTETPTIAGELKTKVSILLAVCVFMWLVLIVNTVFFNGGLIVFGIRPRTIGGLFGIIFAPFLHAGFGHLLANTVPLVILGFFVILDRTRDFFVVTAIVALFSGAGVWLIGIGNSVHIGASGVVFGFLGFLLLRGFFERKLIWILVSVIIGFLFGGMIWGVLPTVPGVSWQSHLFGFIGGVFAARGFRKNK